MTRYSIRAEITVFLSFLLLIVLSFSLGICQVSLLQEQKTVARIDTDHAVFSAFAGFHRPLFHRYHIMSFYLNGENEENQQSLVHEIEQFDPSASRHEIPEFQLMTDLSAAAFYEQAVGYSKKRYGIDAASKLIGLKSKWEEQDIMSEQARSSYNNRTAIPESAVSDSSEDDTVPLDDSVKDKQNLEDINRVINLKGLAKYVLKTDQSVSYTETNLSRLPSHRSLKTGRGIFPVASVSDLTSKAMFIIYAQNHFTCLTDSAASNDSHPSDSVTGSPSSPLSFQLEYIICGKESDGKNLESVLWKIFFMRLAFNILALKNDTGRLSQAQAYAAAISMLILMPEAAESIKETLLLAWAMGESVVDLRSLCDGYKIPLNKTSSQWSLSLPELFTLSSTVDTKRGLSLKEGFSYTDYLRGLLLLSKKDTLCLRSLDMIELSLSDDSQPFLADHCLTKAKIHSVSDIGGSFSYDFDSYFSYLP